MSTVAISIQAAVVTLTDAQIKALPTTPITIIAATAAGYRNKLLGVTLNINSTAGAYTNIDAAAAKLYLETSGSSLLTSPLANDSGLGTPLARLSTALGATNLIVDLLPLNVTPITDGASGTLGYNESIVTSTAANASAKSVRIVISNAAAGALTGGNAANTMKVTAYYTIEQL